MSYNTESALAPIPGSARKITITTAGITEVHAPLDGSMTARADPAAALPIDADGIHAAFAIRFTDAAVDTHLVTGDSDAEAYAYNTGDAEIPSDPALPAGTHIIAKGTHTHLHAKTTSGVQTAHVHLVQIRGVEVT